MDDQQPESEILVTIETQEYEDGSMKLLFIHDWRNVIMSPSIFEELVRDEPALETISVKLRRDYFTPRTGMFDNLTSLKELYWINHIYDRVPEPREVIASDTFDDLVNLERLEITLDNVILEEGIFDKMENLKRASIDLFNGEIPEGLFDHNTELEDLLLGLHSSYQAIPTGLFDNLQKLEKLYFHCEDNPLPEHLFSSSLENLEELAVSLFRKTIPANLFDTMGNLKSLMLTSWKREKRDVIEEYEQPLFQPLPNLKKLEFIRTNLESLEADMFDRFEQLEYLNMRENKISELPNGIIDNMYNLEELILHDNQITDLHPGIFRDLNQLDYLGLSGNNIAEIHPEQFKGLDNLGHLHLSGNEIEEIPTGLLSNLPSLRSLWIIKNKIKKIDVDEIEAHENLIGIKIDKDGLDQQTIDALNKTDIDVDYR